MNGEKSTLQTTFVFIYKDFLFRWKNLNILVLTAYFFQLYAIVSEDTYSNLPLWVIHMISAVRDVCMQRVCMYDTSLCAVGPAH